MLAFHGIFGAYGFWLPNDPRGSWSTWIGSWNLYHRGPATKVDTRRSVAHVGHNHRQRLAVKEVLRYPPIRFNGLQAKAIGEGFAQACAACGYRIFACAILPEHVHVVIAAHRHDPGRVLGHLKSMASQRLATRGLHPLSNYAGPDGLPPTCWARRGWKVYLNTPEDVSRSIEYVMDNPVKDGLPRQRWSFVTPFEG